MVVRMKTQFKVIGFDLDGTLVNSLPDLALSVNSALADFGLPQAPEELVDCTSFRMGKRANR